MFGIAKMVRTELEVTLREIGVNTNEDKKPLRRWFLYDPALRDLSKSYLNAWCKTPNGVTNHLCASALGAEPPRKYFVFTLSEEKMGQYSVNKREAAITWAMIRKFEGASAIYFKRIIPLPFGTIYRRMDKL